MSATTAHLDSFLTANILFFVQNFVKSTNKLNLNFRCSHKVVLNMFHMNGYCKEWTRRPLYNTCGSKGGAVVKALASNVPGFKSWH